VSWQRKVINEHINDYVDEFRFRQCCRARACDRNRSRWRLWELSLDEPYITPVSWAGGVWAKAKDPLTPPPGSKPRIFSGGNFQPDIPLSSLGKREERFMGGSGEPWQWPMILPMWFSYTNPVIGRVPEFYQQDCVPCSVRPDLRLEANGYQRPPDAPEVNKSP
jgi:hypothetical protein